MASKISKPSSMIEEHGQDQTEKNESVDQSHTRHSSDEESTIGHQPNLSHIPTNTSALNRTLSAVRTRESGKDLGPPPDGGFQAWSQVALAHFVIFNTWGYINSFGVFQTYYSQTLGHPPSDISWVGSIQIFLLFFIGTFSGRATDAGYFTFTLACGAILECFSIFMTSLCTKYWQLFLAQGIGQGIGTVASLLGSLRRVPRRGGLVFPAVIMKMLPQVGYGWTMRTLGFISVATLTPCVLFLKQRLPPRKTGPIVEWAAFTELPYLLFAIGMFMNFWGLYVGFFYIGSFSRNIIGVSNDRSIDLLLVMNGVGLIGRLVPNLLADQFTGPLNLLIPFSFATALVGYCWAAVNGMSGLWTFAAFYGLFAAGIQSLFPATLSTLTTDMKKIGVRMGMVLSVVAVAALIGSPIAGELVVRGNGNYLYAQMFMGSAILLGGLTLIGARVTKVGTGLTRV
ncbi:hypothetical protein N7497_007854 [Penicillium chrysogenum]|nr:hypothetical protein N7497_007854 [Penicillium chrysogenum]